MTLAEQIKSFFKGETLDDPATLTEYSRDASLFEIKPQVVLFPKDTEDIKKLVLFVKENKSRGLSITPRSAGTDMTGGPLSESIVLDFTKHLNRIKEIVDNYAIVEPGVFYRDFEKETLRHGLLFPSYPASRESCAIGGIVANNSGGEKSLTYGKTEKYVLGLKAILADGNEYSLGPLAKNELQAKMRLNNFESEIYRKTYELVDRNYDAIQKARPQVSKNSAGYYLWNVWDKETFDLSALLVGSQGTLGIITEAKLKLVRPKTHSMLLVIFIQDLRLLPEAVRRVLLHSPESFESYDDHTFKIALKYIRDVIKFFKGKNPFALARQFLPEFWMVISGGIPKMVLLAEFTGDTEEEALAKMQKAQKELNGLPLKTRLISKDGEERKYWVIRRESYNLLRHHITDRQTAPFIDDIVVRPEKLGEFLPELDKVMSGYNLTYTVAGHIGDGNFHIIPLMDLKDPKTQDVILELSKKVYELVFRFGGSMTGEHNDGIIRAPFLEAMYGKEVYGLFKEIKKIFDPDGIFNPGKKIETLSEDFIKTHLRKERVSK